MPRPSKGERIDGEHYRWILQRRGGVYFADGRSNRPNLGRRSLSTRSLSTARERVRELDRKMAIKHGLVAACAEAGSKRPPVSLEQGMDDYLAYVGRPRSLGGARATTKKRYRPPLERFVGFIRKRGLATWQEVRAAHIRAYIHSIHDDDYCPSTQTLEGTVLKQVLKWLAREGSIEPVDLSNCRFVKSKVSNAYCYSDDEVRSMVAHCGTEPKLKWVGDVIVMLAHTGLRIGELRDLRWDDFDLEKDVESLTLRDTSLLERASNQKDARHTKSGRDRSIPLHPNILALLERLPRTPDGFVFHGPKGGRLKPDFLRRIFIRFVLKPTAKAAKLPEGADFLRGRLHSFRHFFCSRAAEQGISELTIREWLGHSSSQMVARYYHQRTAAACREIRKLPSLVSEGTKTDGEIG